jgi:hypothetical protein
MKKSIKIFLSLAILFFSFQVNAQFRFGVLAGNNFSDMATIDKGFSIKTMKKSFHIGGIIEYQISKLSESFSAESGLVLNWKGTKIRSNESLGSSITTTISPIYLEVPVNAIYIVDFGTSKLQLFAGPYLGYMIGGKIKTEFSPFSQNDTSESLHGIKSLDFGVNIGAGIKMDDILVRLQYGYGLTNLESGGSGTNEIKNRDISISIGCMLPEK